MQSSSGKHFVVVCNAEICLEKNTNMFLFGNVYQLYPRFNSFMGSRLGSHRSSLISYDHAELLSSTLLLVLCLASNHGNACALCFGPTPKVGGFLMKVMYEYATILVHDLH